MSNLRNLLSQETKTAIFIILSDLLILFSEVLLACSSEVFLGNGFFLKLLTFAYRNTVKKYYLEIFSVRNNALGENI